MSKTVKYIDLLAGLGGIRLGFSEGLKAHGIKSQCVFSSELKDYAIKAYHGYFGNENVSGDITKIPTTDIPDFDFLLAGFPCQPFSSAGQRLGFSDTRGTLFFEIERILKYLEQWKKQEEYLITIILCICFQPKNLKI